MHRKDREETDFAAIVKIIDACEILRLGLADGDFPYILPVNFAYTVEGERICFNIHGAAARIFPRRRKHEKDTNYSRAYGAL